MILYLLLFKFTFFTLSGFFIIKILKNTRPWLLVASTFLLALVIFFWSDFTVAHDSHGCSEPLVRSYPRYLYVNLIWSSTILPKMSCASEIDMLFSFGVFYSLLLSSVFTRYLSLDFLFSSWCKCGTMSLLVCWSIYRTLPCSFTFWYQDFYFTYTIPIHL